MTPRRLADQLAVAPSLCPRASTRLQLPVRLPECPPGGSGVPVSRGLWEVRRDPVWARRLPPSCGIVSALCGGRAMAERWRSPGRLRWGADRPGPAWLCLLVPRLPRRLNQLHPVFCRPTGRRGEEPLAGCQAGPGTGSRASGGEQPRPPRLSQVPGQRPHCALVTASRGREGLSQGRGRRASPGRSGTGTTRQRKGHQAGRRRCPAVPTLLLMVTFTKTVHPSACRHFLDASTVKSWPGKACSLQK